MSSWPAHAGHPVTTRPSMFSAFTRASGYWVARSSRAMTRCGTYEHQCPSIQCQRHHADGRLLRLGLDAEVELAAHLQHHAVLAQHLALDAAQAFAARVADDELHQLPAEPVPLEVGAHQDRVFAAFVIGIGVDMHDAEEIARRLVDR